MGFYIRRQKKLGLLNLNLSKSGLGVSTGVTGARLVFSPKGTYVHLGRHGLYYRKKISTIEKSNSSNVQQEDLRNFYTTTENDIETVNFENLTDIDSQEFVQELESKELKISVFNTLFPLLILGLLALTFYIFIYPVENLEELSYAIIKNNVVNLREEPSTKSKIVHKAKINEEYKILSISDKWAKIEVDNETVAYVYSSLISKSDRLDKSQITNTFNEKRAFSLLFLIIYIVIFIVLVIYSRKVDKKKKTIELYYDLDDELNENYNKFIQAFQNFSETDKVWQIKNTNSGYDAKYNAGAETLIKREVITSIFLHRPPIKYFMTNVYIPYIGLNNIEFYFFPERLLMKQNRKYAAISYDNLNIQSDTSRFVEESSVPQDADIIDYSWQYMNKKGGPDKRFSNNKEIPVCSYTYYNFSSKNGLNEIISTSKTKGMDDFMFSIQELSLPAMASKTSLPTTPKNTTQKNAESSKNPDGNIFSYIFKISELPQESQNAIFLMDKWYVNEGDYARKGEVIFSFWIIKKDEKTGAQGIMTESGLIKKVIIQAGGNIKNGERCCEIEPVESKEEYKYIQNFKYFHYSEEVKPGCKRIHFNKAAYNDNDSVSSLVNILTDEFSDSRDVFTSSIIVNSLKDADIYVMFYFKCKNNKTSLVTSIHKKFLNPQKGTKIYFLFADGTKELFEFQKDGERAGKDDIGVIYENEVLIDDNFLKQFSTTPFEKFKIENPKAGKEIIAAQNESNYKSKISYERENILLTKSFMDVVDNVDKFLTKSSFNGILSNGDSLLAEAARVVVANQSASTSYLQRHFFIGYNRAGRLIDQLEMLGIVGLSCGSKAREVLISDESSLEKYLKNI